MIDVDSISKDRISLFQTRLLLWFESHARLFPWRTKELTDYQIIISEILLQRTKAETVSKFYDFFLSTYPNWELLAEADTIDLENILRPIGLYKQRSQRLIALAKEMVSRKGILPRERSELEKIPFFGQYIANAIELQVFKRAKPLLDVNMARVLERYFGARKLADIRYDPFLQTLSHTVVNHNLSKELNWAILDFAALICKSRTPICLKCCLSSDCEYFKILVNKS